jgi:hypothetical protein
MKRITIVALALAALAVAGPASAQENATFTLRSGERLSGQLMDLGGVGFTVRVDGQERRIPANDVAVIDFTGGGTSQQDWDRLNNGPFAVLRDGQVVTGQLTDVGGSSPLRLSFQSSGANRDLQSSEVARIVLARPANTGNTATSPSSPAVTSPDAASGNFTVSGQQPWTPTGMVLRRGENVVTRTSGEVRFGPGTANPHGSPDKNAGNPMPSVGTGALIGRIGERGQPFFIGVDGRFQAPAAGQLFLGINDTHFGDNEGSYQVEVQRGTGRTRR